MQKKHYKILSRTTALTIAMGLFQTQAVAADDADMFAIEEIVVSAQKRAESAQRVPISITAYSAAKIEAQGLKDLGDLATSTPGLTFGDFSDLKLSPIGLRGISASSGSAGQDPAVGIYVDEVFLGSGVSANIDLFDIERIEVLRGPQGTLFGRNTVGGVINITTKKPPEEFSGYASTSYGNYNNIQLRGAIGGPVVKDKLFVNISGVFQDRDGFTKNLYDNTRGDNAHNWGLRGSALLRPTENAEFTLTVEHNEVDQSPKYFETLSYAEGSFVGGLLDAADLPRNTNPYDRKVYSSPQSQ